MEGRNRSRLLPKIRALDTELVVTFVPTESRINEKKGEKREGKKRKSRHGKLAWLYFPGKFEYRVVLDRALMRHVGAGRRNGRAANEAIFAEK